MQLYLLVQTQLLSRLATRGSCPLIFLCLIKLHYAGAATDPVPRGPPAPFVNSEGWEDVADGKSLPRDKGKLTLTFTLDH